MGARLFAGLYSVRSLILSQWIDLRTGYMRKDLGALTTTPARKLDNLSEILEDYNRKSYSMSEQ